MERGSSPVLTAPVLTTLVPTTPGARSAVPSGITVERTAQGRRGRLRELLMGLGDSCALAGVALLGCLALIALGTVCSLLWMLVADR
jgi:hypothetical protein